MTSISPIAVLSVLLLIGIPSWLLYAAASPDEFSGRVIDVLDGDSMVVEGLGRIRLADINSYQLPTQDGLASLEFTRQMLLGKRVHLDLDAKNSRCPAGCKIVMLYVKDPDGSLNGTSFNRMLVDAGHAVVADRLDNEFNPANWWAERAAS